jgi:hypothetical protein
LSGRWCYRDIVAPPMSDRQAFEDIMIYVSRAIALPISVSVLSVN